MDKDKFNKYCAEVMGYEEVEPPKTPTGTYFRLGVWVSNGGSGRWNFNPWDDLNVMAEVVEIKMNDVEPRNYQYFHEEFMTKMLENGVKQAFREFIISTMED